MKYNLDVNGYIRNYAIVGDVEDGRVYAGELPADFAAHSSAYKIVDGALALDAEKAAAIDAGNGEEGGSGAEDAQAAKIRELEAISADQDEMLLDLQMQIIDMQLGL